MQIDKHISNLLYRHDCVILPEFGGFVTDYASAKVHPISNTFNPPSKNILFNSELIQNDGLLIHNISLLEGITYDKSKTIVESFVKDCKSDLQQGKKIKFDNIGTIYKDFENNIIFEPLNEVNFLEESFGLPVFKSNPILRKTANKRLEKKFIDRKPIPEKDKRRKKVYWVLTALIPVFLIVGWLIINPQIINKNTQHSSVFPLSEVEMNDTDNSELQVKENNKQSKSLKDFKFEETEDPEQKLNNSSDEIPKEVSKIDSPKYYIIGGAFRIKANADNLIISLRSKGYDAEYAGVNPNGLHIVSYFKTEDKSEALINLSIIRKNDNSSAWLLKK